MNDPTTEPSTIDRVLAGGGEMGRLMREMDWSRTSLGPVSGWPQSLRTAVSMMLDSRFAMVVAWGPDFIFLYNDRYRPVLGASKHPRALGLAAREIFPEVWDFIGPLFRQAVGGEAVALDDVLIPLDRNGYLEECFFTLSYSPIRDERSDVGGMLAVVAETTERVQGERRLLTLRDLAARTNEAKTADEAVRNAATTLARNPADIPFALFYLVDDDRKLARLAVAAGLPTGGAAAPETISLAGGGELGWPLAEAARTSDPTVVRDLPQRMGALPGGEYPEPTHTAVVLPLIRPGLTQPDGFLVAGVSPRHALDEKYQVFFSLAADQIITAISNARAYEEEKRRAEALAALDRAKTTFFSNISHEFRTPLTLMLGPTEEALASPERALRGDDLETVHRNELRLLRLVNALLDFSRIEAGRAQASYAVTDLAAATADLASSFRSAAERAGLRLEVDCPPLASTAYVDHDMWEKIVLNLLSNAFKFTFEGSIRVALREAGGRIELEVADTGVGIPAAALPRLFERFHRIEGTRSRTQEGSGIGLALVHDLVELHGGTISVSTREGQGASFVVSLPVGSAHLPPDRIGAPSTVAGTASRAESFVSEALRWLPAEAGTAGVAPSAGPRVLVADDNADMRDYLGRILRQQFTVEVVSDGAEALAAARAHLPDLVLTDVMMPHLDGFGLLRALRGNPLTADIPVVLLSARAGEEARVDGFQSGADDYLVKPFSARELLAKVASLIQLRGARQEAARERAVLLERERVARREAELQREHLHALFDQAPNPIVILRGPEYRIELANASTCRVWGRRPEDVMGRPLFEVMPERRGQGFEELLHKVMSTGETTGGKEFAIRADRQGNGILEEAFFNFVYTPLRGPGGQTEGVLVAAFDVTDEVRARDQMSRLREEAEGANRSKDAFLAMLGHELRNPLSPIVTAVQLMRMRGSTDREIDVIERQVRQLGRMVDDLLDVARITRGKVELRKERVELAAVVLRGLEMASPLLEQRRHPTDLSIPPEGLPVDGDLDRLAQVVSNLLTNAAKYSEVNTTIHISAAAEDGRAVLRVRDHGVGVPPDMLERIFELFVQQPQSLDRAKGGLGLGLTIVRRLVEAHGGSVTAHSDGPGRGSQFVVSLPLAARQSDVVATPSRVRVARPGQAPADPQRNRVLIVDDNADAAQTIGEVLGELGYQIEIAHDGPSALARAVTFKPHICLLDIGLPVMDGYEVARRLRELPGLPPNMRIVALTGYGQDADRRRSEDAGFNGHVVKPVDIETLTHVVAN